MEFILVLALILIFTKLAGDLSVRLGQPSVLGKLIVGVVIGPALLGWVDKSDFVHYMAEIGVLLLMFIAGLETDLEQLKKTGRPLSLWQWAELFYLYRRIRFGNCFWHVTNTCVVLWIIVLRNLSKYFRANIERHEPAWFT